MPRRPRRTRMLRAPDAQPPRADVVIYDAQGRVTRIVPADRFARRPQPWLRPARRLY